MLRKNYYIRYEGRYSTLKSNTMTENTIWAVSVYDENLLYICKNAQTTLT